MKSRNRFAQFISQEGQTLMVLPWSIVAIREITYNQSGRYGDMSTVLYLENGHSVEVAGSMEDCIEKCEQAAGEGWWTE